MLSSIGLAWAPLSHALGVKTAVLTEAGRLADNSEHTIAKLHGAQHLLAKQEARAGRSAALRQPSSWPKHRNAR